MVGRRATLRTAGRRPQRTRRPPYVGTLTWVHGPAWYNRAPVPADSRVISIVDADPDLADVLDASEVEHARRDGLVRLTRLSPGAWDAAAAIEPGIHHRGFLVV